MTEHKPTSASSSSEPSNPSSGPHSGGEGRHSPSDAIHKPSDGDKTRQRTVAKEAVDFWYDKRHKDLLFYLSIGIVFLELIIGGVAFFYGVIHAKPAQDGLPPQFQFPWLVYSIAAVVGPAVLLLIVHLAGVGLFRSLRDKSEEDEAWRQDLPERLRKVYAIVQGAPTVLLLVGVMALGAALFYIDGAMTALFRLGSTMEVYLPWIIGAIAGGWCIAYLARIWLNYRSKRLEAEYAFRREVLERTGVIIVDRGSVQLPPSFMEEGTLRALENGAGLALGQGERQGTPEEKPEGPVIDVGGVNAEQEGRADKLSSMFDPKNK